MLVDGVSSIGGMPFASTNGASTSRSAASQKCLMSSPGVAFAALSDRAWQARTTSRLPRFYWDFEEIRQFVTKPRPLPPGTPPVHTVLQVTEALRMIHEEGLERVYQRHDRMSAATRRGVAALGLSLQCPSLKDFSSTVTAIAVPSDTPHRRPRSDEGTRDRDRGRAGTAWRTAVRIGHMGGRYQAG